MEDPIVYSSLDWINASISIMELSMHIGARLYPLICGFGLVRMIIENV